MNNKIRWLRVSYWAGAVVDAYAAIRWMFPDIFSRPSADIGYNLGMKWGVALMVGWTFLLIWADRKPFERKDILLLTVCPVIVGLMITSVATFNAGFFGTVQDLILNLSIMTILIVFMTFSYLNARES
jgi:hypothetical protein